jgi:hypothetical protein
MSNSYPSYGPGWVIKKKPPHRHNLPTDYDGLEPTWGEGSVWKCGCGTMFTWYGEFWGWLSQEDHDNLWPQHVPSLESKRKWRIARNVAVSSAGFVAAAAFVILIGLYGG